MIQVITREWEITKTFIFEVVMGDGLVKLDWQDFELMAQAGRPAVTVRVDALLSVSEQTAKALDEVRKNINGTLSCVMAVIFFKKDKELMMEELGGLNGVLSDLVDENVQIYWSIQQAEEMTNDRRVMLFAFEK